MTTLKVGNIEHPDGGSNSVSIGGTGGILLPVGTTAQRPGNLDSTDQGLVRFNSQTGQVEYWSTTSSTPQWRNINNAPIITLSVQYLVVAGGGAAGTYKSGIGYGSGDDGENSRWSDKIAIGGGGGTSYGNVNGRDGGSGGGAGGGGSGAGNVGGSGTAGQGNDGGAGGTSNGYWPGGGGGGAGAAGQSATSTTPGNGGNGVTTTIISTTQAIDNSVGEVSGTDVYFAGGGGGCKYSSGTSTTGGLGGGKAGSNSPSSATNGTANTGGGGGATDNGGAGHGGGGAGGVLSGTVSVNAPDAQTLIVGAGGTNSVAENFGVDGASRGGSGVVILKYSNTFTSVYTGTVTKTTITDGSYKIDIVKATSGDCTVSWQLG